MKHIIIFLSFIILTTSIQAESSYSKFLEKRHNETVIKYLNVANTLSSGPTDDLFMIDYINSKKYAIRAFSIMENENMDMNSFLASRVYLALSFGYSGAIKKDATALHREKMYKKSIMYGEKSVELKKIHKNLKPTRNGETLEYAKSELAYTKNKLIELQKELSK